MGGKKYISNSVTEGDSLRVASSKVMRERIIYSQGGDPVAPSSTATLLRLHPSH